MKILRLFPLLAISLYFISCGTQKQMPPYYLQRATDTTIKGEVSFPELRIQKNDLLSIQVYSLTTRPEVDALYNLPTAAPGAPGQTISGYLVDGEGNIEFPRLGTVKAEGLTKQELSNVIKKKLTDLHKTQLLLKMHISQFTMIWYSSRPPM